MKGDQKKIIEDSDVIVKMIFENLDGEGIIVITIRGFSFAES